MQPSWEANPASPIQMQMPLSHEAGVHSHGTAHAPVLGDERMRQDTPLWMDVPQTQQEPQVRRGATPAPRSGLGTLAFFGLIILAVGAAGAIGVAVWGPEKTTKGGSHLASNPPPPTTMPSLPEEAPPVVESAAPAAVESAAPAPSSSAKKKKAAPKVTSKKH